MDDNYKKKLTLTRLRVQKFRARKKLKSDYCEQQQNNHQAEHETNSSSSSDVNAVECASPSMDSDVNDNLNGTSQEEVHSDYDNNNSELIASSESSSDEQSDERQPEVDHNPSNSEDEMNGFDLEKKQLQHWAVEHRIAHVHLDSLLKILRARLLPSLPACSKTFLNTGRAKYNVVNMEDVNGTDGTFAYIGIESGLLKCINTRAHNSHIIELQFNCDGLSLSKSSSCEIWPILCKVHSSLVNYEPFVVALYCGHSKPKRVEEFTKMFVVEINDLLKNGIFIGDVNYSIVIKCFICDTPARAFLKCIKGHTSSHACERCTCVGNRVDKTMTFTSTNNNLRTDKMFRDFDDPDHHNKASPLTLIEPKINMISIFVLDFMHLGFLGANSKLMDYWCSGNTKKKKHSKRKLSTTHLSEITRRIKMIKLQTPREFQRQLRDLNDVSKWKATEHKLFLLYIAPIVLKKIISPTMYDNFILLHAASRLLWSSETAIQCSEVARKILEIFFLEAQGIYGITWATVNMHHLTHLVDDVINMNCSLSEINAFSYENLLGKIRRILRSPYRSVAQLCRRTYEKSLVQKPPPLKSDLIILKENEQEILNLQYKEFFLSNGIPNNFALLRDGRIVEIHKIFRDGNLIKLKGVLWKIKDSVYTKPLHSIHLNIYELHNRSSSIIIVSIDRVKSKIMKIAINFSENSILHHYAISLLH